MPSPTKASPDNIEISSIFSAVKGNLKTIVLLSALAAALTYAALLLFAPKYQSEAELAIEAPSSDGTGFDAISTKMDKEAINTHVRALRATDILEAVANKLNLKSKPEFNAALGAVDEAGRLMRMIGLGGIRVGESDRDRVLNTLRNQLEVYSAKESRFIGIRMTSIDPVLAADIANSVADAYRSSLANESVNEADEKQKVIEAKLAKLTPELATLETEVERYRRKIDSFKGGAQNVGLNEQQMSDLTAEVVRAKSARGDAEVRARSAREMMKLGTAEALPEVQKSPLIQNLVQQRVRIERQISELSATLLPAHPRMRQLNADLAGLKTQLNAEVGKFVDGLEKEAKAAAEREASIKKSLDDIKTKVTDNAPEEARLRQLEADAGAKRQELDNLRRQLEANRKKLDARAAPVEVKIISEAQAASVPIFPKKTSLSALIGVATMLFGTAMTILKALFLGARGGAVNAIKPAAQSALRAEPVLPIEAAIAAKTVAPSTTPAAMPASTLGPKLTDPNALADRIMARKHEHSGYRTLVTGRTNAVDAGEEAVRIAKDIAAGQLSAILVNWSTTGKGIADAAGIAPENGLSELLLGKVRFPDIVYRLPGSDAHFITCGASLGNSHNLDPDQLNLVLDALDETYDHIVVAAEHDDARMLFEIIQGRFDAGVIVSDNPGLTPLADDPPGTLLGFEVADIDIIQFSRSDRSPEANQRLQRALRRAG